MTRIWVPREVHILLEEKLRFVYQIWENFFSSLWYFSRSSECLPNSTPFYSHISNSHLRFRSNQHSISKLNRLNLYPDIPSESFEILLKKIVDKWVWCESGRCPVSHTDKGFWSHNLIMKSMSRYVWLRATIYKVDCGGNWKENLDTRQKNSESNEFF